MILEGKEPGFGWNIFFFVNRKFVGEFANKMERIHGQKLKETFFFAKGWKMVVIFGDILSLIN